MIEIKDKHVKKLEKQIVDFYNELSKDYNKGRMLLETRKKLINHYVLEH